MASTEHRDWRMAVCAGEIERKSGSILIWSGARARTHLATTGRGCRPRGQGEPVVLGEPGESCWSAGAIDHAAAWWSSCDGVIHRFDLPAP